MRLNKSHAKPAVEVLVKAFWNNPPLNYYFSDELERKRIASFFLSAAVFSGIRYGEVYATSPNLEGIAVWIPSHNYPITFWKLLRSVPLSAIFGFGKYGGNRMKLLGEHVDAIHEQMSPFRHWFLQIIGVDPSFQGNGYAGKLIHRMLSRVDAEGLPCYLETLDYKNVPLYEHFGFRVVDESIVPDTELTNWAMLRPEQIK
ncbi:GNAT family N-acetyltransferase [Chloroflexota bacterium]